MAANSNNTSESSMGSPAVPPYMTPPGFTSSAGPATQPWTYQPGAGTFRPPPPFSLNDGIVGDPKAAKNRPDASKYKTELCHNWELSGTCSYRQCTFAHGPDELRKPVTAPQPVAPPQAATDAIMEKIWDALSSDRETQMQQLEGNRSLETQLRRAQQERMADKRRLEELEAEISRLRGAISVCDEQLEAAHRAQFGGRAPYNSHGCADVTDDQMRQMLDGLRVQA